MQQMIQKAITKTGLSLLLSVFSYVSLTHAGTPFTTDGNFSVGNDGSANYSIPIQVPPGTAGMAPTLSLNYNSNGGNGMLGMGWGIDGLSQISRCPQTLVQDGQVRGVSYDQNDKLCLDGQRLISTGGTYGANGTEYRAEQANFARIISYTSDINNGPDSFKVWTKAGQVIEYGNTADSRIEAAGKTVIRSWATNKISDTKGNYISVSYTEDNANGEAYVNRIDYTGNSNTGLAPYANVQFEYEDRPDISIAYQAGSIIKSTKRMTNIKTYTNNTTLVKDYRLTYEQGTATQRSRLKTLSECDGVGAICKEPLIAIYPNEKGFIKDDTWLANIAGEGFYHGYGGTGLRVIDLNGDGLPDLLHLGFYTSAQFGGGIRKAAFINTGRGYVRDDSWVSNLLDSTFYHQMGLGGQTGLEIADVNGDGLPDLIHLGYFTKGEYGGGQVNRVFINTGSGFIKDDTWLANIAGEGFYHGYGGTGLRVIDLNGDGLPDLLHLGFYTSAQFGGGIRKAAFINTGRGYVRDDSWVSNLLDSTFYHQMGLGGQTGLEIADVNGDGLPDLIHLGYFTKGEYGGGQVNRVFINTGSGFIKDDTWLANIAGEGFYHGYGGTGLRVIDLNGDGLPDLLHLGFYTSAQFGGGIRKAAFINTGRGYVRDDSWVSNLLDSTFYHQMGLGGQTGLEIADVNGDGLPDLIHLGYFTKGEYGGGQVNRVFINTGSGFIKDDTWLANIAGEGFYHGYGGTGLRVIDLNGDGLPDLLHLGFYTSAQFGGGQFDRVYLNQTLLDSKFIKVTPGLSSAISLSYKPITDGSVYVKGAAGESGTTECPFPVGEDGTTNSYPILNLQAPMYVVSSASVSDGNSGTLTNTYQYGGLKAHVKGRGSLGFRYQQVTQTDADINSTTFFRQDYPYIGLPCQTEKRVTSTNTLIGASALSYANAPKSEGSATSQFPYLTQSVEQSFELDGSLINTTTKTNQFDDYGNATQITVDSGDGYTKTTNNEYYNDTSNGKWLLGRLLRSTVTSTSPDTAPTLPGGGGGTTTPPPTSTSWTHCANEWSWCGFWGETKTVRFGVGNQWVEGSFTDGVNCNGGSFGGVDPAPGTAKTCEIADTTTTPPPAANASPTISLVAGSSTATQGDNISLTATASDSDGTITQVTFYDGANLIGTDSSAPYSLTWTTDTNTTTGTHNLTAKATDDGGAEGNSGVVAVTLNAATPLPPANVAPSVSITNPPNGISVPGPIDVQITADASDSDGTIAEVAFYANGNLLGTDTTAPYAVDVTGVQAGNYTVTATATDDDGATTSASVQVTVN